MKKALVFAFAALLARAVGAATPTVSTISGSFVDQGTCTIAGANFDSKSTAAPILWAPFRTSAAPDPLGQYGAFNQVQNLAYAASVGYDGSGGMQGTAGNGVWTLRVDSSGFNWTDYSQKFHVMRRVKRNYLIFSTDNDKGFRLWPLGGSGYPNLYWSIQNGRFFVENIGGGTDAGFWGSNNPNTTSWIFEEIVVQASSANGVKDGSLLYRINGQDKASGNLITRSAAAPAAMASMYPGHVVVANKSLWSPAWSASNNAWMDDIYVDKTWQRVLIGDAATYGACRKFGIIVPTAWSTTNINGTLQIHTGDFPPQTTAYVYVFNQANTPNTAGKQILIGGSGGGGNPAPTVTSVNVSVGSYLGGTVATATCTGLLATPTVMVGTQAATGVVMNSATSIRFTIPAHSPPGDSGLDLTITNPDAQFGVLPATMSYTSPVANQAPYNVDAGDNYFLTLPATMPLSGNALDDGLPNPPHALTYLWQKKSGPGTVTFVDATALTTTASFSVAGTYTISLTANDSALQTESDPITILVSSPIGVAIPPWRP